MAPLVFCTQSRPAITPDDEGKREFVFSSILNSQPVLSWISFGWPSGHFFGSAHTLARYETAFYQPFLSDWRNFETWQEDGARTATERANRIWKQLLAEYEPPPLDPGCAEALDASVERRKREIRGSGAR